VAVRAGVREPVVGGVTPDAPTPLTRSADSRSPAFPKLSAFYELTKPGITAFVGMTAGAAFYMGSHGQPQLVPLLHTLLGTLAGTGGALALNQYVERDIDARMVRTRTRPLPSGRMAPREALAFGAFMLALGVGYLWAFVGWLPAIFTAASAAAYLALYTPLKSRSYLATLVGAIPGAVPAFIGWSAASGNVEVGAMVLFAIAFLWQLPHVLALAWLLREDYERAGFFMTPPTDASGARVGKHMVYHSVSLLLVSLTPTLLGLTGAIYFAGAILLGGALLGVTMAAAADMTRTRARRVFLGSLLYQPILLALMLLDVVRG
jgi:heme o synthase